LRYYLYLNLYSIGTILIILEYWALDGPSP